MEQMKPWFQSTGMWGAALALGCPIIERVAHVTISQADIAMAVDSLTQMGTLVGGVMALVGRIKATHKIG